MMTTDDKKLYEKVKMVREKMLSPPSLGKRMAKAIKLKWALVMYNKMIYGMLNAMYDAFALKKRVSYENWDLKKPTMPADWKQQMTRLQAKMGLSQLRRLRKDIEKRRQLVKVYDAQLKGTGTTLPPLRNF